jgi:hypothetical protein
MLAQMPRLTSGKIDRKRCGHAAQCPAGWCAEDSDLPETAGRSSAVRRAGRAVPGQPICAEADFFTDLGGHSFFAARLASALRADPRFAHVTVRDIYQQRQIGKLPRKCWPMPPHAAPQNGQWTAAVHRRSSAGPAAGAGRRHAGAGHAAHGAVAGALLHLPLLHRRPGRLGRARSRRRSASSC